MSVDPEDLYERLHSLSKVLESSGRIDESEHRDAYPTILDSMNFVRERIREAEVLRAERDRARAGAESAARLLAGIYSLLYPAPVILEDGRQMAFRPKSLDPHEVLQELSDRIRALPDEMEKIAGRLR